MFRFFGFYFVLAFFGVVLFGGWFFLTKSKGAET